ncbi:NAD-dependent epimerase/dehydratase family protein [Streptomyces sp. NPDC056500]|uniref:NAD-dependent epimerase/dehydratase family protein n=1 Tax=Streptomyces sp. NPDC056500 TaxID=3345840 RepID=UPI0036CC5B58
MARRIPQWTPPGVEWVGADLAREDGLVSLFRGTDAVVHLAWRFQPARRPAVAWQTNVLGSIRVFRAAAEAGVPTVVYAAHLRWTLDARGADAAGGASALL